MSSHSDLDGMGSIPASPDARNVPLLLCQERFNEASLSDVGYCLGPEFDGYDSTSQAEAFQNFFAICDKVQEQPLLAGFKTTSSGQMLAAVKVYFR